MSILDKLVEKKDIKTFIKTRKAVLQETISKEKLMKRKPKDREELKTKVYGRIAELDFIKELLHKKDGFKELSKKDWGLVGE